ncbi:squalene/phytoene synthase family protein [Pendulispora albinea]|uniref:Squalene/phytoene synthase family protein n=1 Tax=Pendulispora albinea TaxID=2741071 RepID=A0ABZ2M3V4_9BACT
MKLLDEAQKVVCAYSRTWYEPITSMPRGLSEATTAAYLCMRGIDEIEDHPFLDGKTKAHLLRQVAATFQGRFSVADFGLQFHTYARHLPDVTLRLGEWTRLAPSDIAPRVLETFATLAERMAWWAEADFYVQSEQDLNRYTYTVAGTLALLLCDLWAWHDGTRSNRTLGVGYGRALQSINILIDRHEGTGRGENVWPEGWQTGEMLAYARRELHLADAYLAGLPAGPARTFCQTPLARAHRSLARAGDMTENKRFGEGTQGYNMGN